MTTRRLTRELEEAMSVYALMALKKCSPKEMNIAELLLVLAVEALEKAPLCSPRVRYTQADFGGARVSFWAHTRSAKKEEVWFKFLGMPRFLLMDLAEKARPLLQQYDKEIERRGKPTALDHVDVVALAVRYTQLSSLDYMEHLCIEFGRTGRRHVASSECLGVPWPLRLLQVQDLALNALELREKVYLRPTVDAAGCFPPQKL